MREGIAIAGTIVTDIVKMIDAYPEKGMLSAISHVCRAVGGCVPNTAIDLAVMDCSLPVWALGCVGNDENGRFIREEITRYGVNGSLLTVSQEQTGFTDVMTVEKTGERTFFARAGANNDFDLSEDFIRHTNVRLLHVGYLTMLGKSDAPDSEYGTVLARRLCAAQKAGIRTSVDLVSAPPQKLRSAGIPALRYCDYAVMNETEACSVAGVPARDEKGKLLTANIHLALERLFAAGVREAVAVHCPEAGFLRTRTGEVQTVPSLLLPRGYIRGSVGAGDAFCAACLHGFYTERNPREILEFASGAAACNLSAADAVSGMRSIEEIEKTCKKYPRRTIDTI